MKHLAPAARVIVAARPPIKGLRKSGAYGDRSGVRDSMDATCIPAEALPGKPMRRERGFARHRVQLGRAGQPCPEYAGHWANLSVIEKVVRLFYPSAAAIKNSSMEFVLCRRCDKRTP